MCRRSLSKMTIGLERQLRPSQKLLLLTSQAGVVILDGMTSGARGICPSIEQSGSRYAPNDIFYFLGQRRITNATVRN